MNTNSVFSFMDILVVACGVYVLYLYVEMVKGGKIRENMLLPKGLNVKKCKDINAFIRYIGPKQLILGISALLCGAAGLLQDFTTYVSPPVYLCTLFLFFACAIWYTFVMKKAVKMFW